MFFLQVFIAAVGQLNTNLVVSGRPPSTISDWGNRKEVLTYIITNQSGAAYSALIRVELKTTDGTLVASNNLSRATVYSLGSATMIFYAADVLPLENMIFNGRWRSVLEKTGKLPEGSYQICVQLLRSPDLQPLSTAICRNFYVASAQFPINLMPANDAVLEAQAAQSAIIFRWSPVSPNNGPVYYRIQVFEIYTYQTAMQAFRSNQPVLDHLVSNMTQYIWQPQLDMFSSCCPSIQPAAASDSLTKKEGSLITRRFIWSIQSSDLQGRPLTDGNVNGDGRNEPTSFFIEFKKNTPILPGKKP
jgi:hypothetical protein